MHPVHVRRVLALTLMFLFAASRPASAQPELNGFHVLPGHTAREFGLRAIPDGMGGAFVSLKSADPRFVYPEVGDSGIFYLARLGASGAPDPGWGVSGFSGLGFAAEQTPEVPVKIAIADPGQVWVLADVNISAGTPYHLMRKLDATGVDDPPSVFSSVSYGPGDAVSEPGGRVLFFGEISSNPPAMVRCGVVDPDGSILEGGRDFQVGVNGYLSVAPPPTAIADGQGGAYVVVNPVIGSMTDRDLYVVHVNPDGFATWTPPARMLGPASGDQAEPSMTADGSGGAYFTWSDARDVTKGQDVYAQHLLADGSVAPGWSVWGKAIASFPGPQYRSRLVPDGAGGLWCAWVDGRTAEDDIYFTHLGPDGTPKAGFAAGGIPLSGAAGNQNQLDMVSDGAGGFFAAWVDVRSGTPVLFGQHIHSTGVVMPGWQPNGSLVCAPPSEPHDPHLALTSTNHAIVAWTDDRNVSPQVFALGLPEDGPIAGVGPTARAPLALAPVANPSRDHVELRVSAPDEAPIRVAIVDVTGRIRAEQVLPGPARDLRVRFDAPGAGLYFLRAEQRGVLASARVAVVR